MSREVKFSLILALLVLVTFQGGILLADDPGPLGQALRQLGVGATAGQVLTKRADGSIGFEDATGGSTDISPYSISAGQILGPASADWVAASQTGHAINLESDGAVQIESVNGDTISLTAAVGTSGQINLTAGQDINGTVGNVAGFVLDATGFEFQNTQVIHLGALTDVWASFGYGLIDRTGPELNIVGYSPTAAGNGGGAYVNGGWPTNGNGGAAGLVGGPGAGSNKNGGAAFLQGGAATGAGTPGETWLKPGGSTANVVVYDATDHARLKVLGDGSGIGIDANIFDSASGAGDLFISKIGQQIIGPSGYLAFRESSGGSIGAKFHRTATKTISYDDGNSGAATLAFVGSITISQNTQSKCFVGEVTAISDLSIDFDDGAVQTRSISSDSTFTTTVASLVAGKARASTVVVTNSAADHNLTFPSAWKWLGSKPASISASAVGVLSLMSTGASESDVIAAWTVAGDGS